MSKAKSARQFRLGMLAADLEAAKAIIGLAARGVDLLSPDDKRRFYQAEAILSGLEQRVWTLK